MVVRVGVRLRLVRPGPPPVRALLPLSQGLLPEVLMMPPLDRAMLPLLLLLPVALVMLPLVRLPHAGGSRGNSSMRSGG